MAHLVLATGRVVAFILFLTIAFLSNAATRPRDTGGAPQAVHTGLLDSPWLQGIAAIGLVLIGVCIQAVRIGPLRRRNSAIERLLEEQTHALRLLSSELESAKRTVSEAERASNRFLANVSHELRTPLNSILGFSELLLEGVGSLEDDKQRRFLSNVRHSAQHLLSLINDVVDMSKIESGKMELHVDRLAIGPLVGSTVEMIRGFASPHRITIGSDVARDLPMIFADAVKVRQIVHNLLSNAVRFSVSGGSVSLAVRFVELESSPLGTDSIEIRVADQGSGLPEDAIRAILAEQRLTAVYSKLGMAAGLGLSIVRRFAEMHGGQLSAQSRPGEGSTFRVLLPLDAREHDTDKVSMKV